MTFIALIAASSLAQSADEISLRVSQGTLCIKVKVDGVFRWMAIDTADPVSSIRIDVNEKSIEAAGTAFKATVQIGSQLLNNQSFVARQAGPIGSKIDDSELEVDGILGFRILSQVGLSFDFKLSKARVFKVERSKRVLPLGAYGSRDFKLLFLTRVENSVPTATFQNGGVDLNMVIDLGSYTSFLSMFDAKNRANQLTRAGSWKVRRIEGDSEHDISFLNRMSINNITWKFLPFVLGNPKDDFPSGLGWTVFAPFRFVSFDFLNGCVYVPSKSKSMEFLDHALSIYGTTLGKDKLILPSGESIKFSSIISFVGLGKQYTGYLKNPTEWQPSKIGAARMLRFYEPWKAEIVYKFDGKATTGYLHPFWSSLWKER